MLVKGPPIAMQEGLREASEYPSCRTWLRQLMRISDRAARAGRAAPSRAARSSPEAKKNIRALLPPPSSARENGRRSRTQTSISVGPVLVDGRGPLPRRAPRGSHRRRRRSSYMLMLHVHQPRRDGQRMHDVRRTSSSSTVRCRSFSNLALVGGQLQQQLAERPRLLRLAAQRRRNLHPYSAGQQRQAASKRFCRPFESPCFPRSTNSGDVKHRVIFLWHQAGTAVGAFVDIDPTHHELDEAPSGRGRRARERGKGT